MIVTIIIMIITTTPTTVISVTQYVTDENEHTALYMINKICT